ncbi:uncharacterized protein LOC119293951 [Triticum dicoccoides]|uniref:uncharacterized protein LOC119293951 n=1 Tax=Triticum dicoccoides TaxID=85692 RepID=UPI00188E720D|nr:uncharacterized protein LOC119293951 [Triticum dicoccoides]
MTTVRVLLTVALVISLLALGHHPLAHARHVKDPSMPTGDSSSVKKGLQQGSTMKLDAGKTKKVENVGVEEIQKGSAEPSFGNRGSLGVESDKVAVLARRGEPPKPHPKKHN